MTPSRCGRWTSVSASSTGAASSAARSVAAGSTSTRARGRLGRGENWPRRGGYSSRTSTEGTETSTVPGIGRKTRRERGGKTRQGRAIKGGGLPAGTGDAPTDTSERVPSRRGRLSCRYHRTPRSRVANSDRVGRDRGAEIYPLVLKLSVASAADLKLSTVWTGES